MRYRKLDANGDMTFGQGKLNFFIDSPEGVAQAVLTGLKLWLGEWFIDTTAGVPYQFGVLGKNSKATADSVIRNAILDVQGVESIESYFSTFDGESRLFAVNCRINTIYGQTSVNTIIKPLGEGILLNESGEQGIGLEGGGNIQLE